MPYNIEALLRMKEEGPPMEQQRQAAEQEQRVLQLPIGELQDFPAALHKFKPATGQRLTDLEESIRENGILNAILVRKLPGGQYQIIAGHNRRTAAQNIGYRTVPCIVKDLPDDDDAIRAMIADNMNNRELLPSERGWAYRWELEIRKRQGQRSDLTAFKKQQLSGDNVTSSHFERKLGTNLTSAQNERKLETADIIGEAYGVSRVKIYRYIRLTYLIEPLIDLVDAGKVALGTGEQLSYLKKHSQETVYNFCYAAEPVRPLKEAQAKKLREVEADPDNIIDEELLEEITAKQKKVRFRTLKLEMTSLRSFFPAGTPEEVVVQTIHTALGVYFDRKEDK